MEEFWLNRILTASWHFIVLLLVFLVVLHLLFVWPRNLSKRSWKRADYVWLGVAALGLVSAAADVRISLSKNWAEVEKDRAQAFFSVTRPLFSEPEQSYPCTNGKILAEARMRDEYAMACRWRHKVWDFLKRMESEELSEIREDSLPLVVFVDDNLKRDADWLLERVRVYNEDRRRYMNAKAFRLRSGLEEMLAYLAPFLLSFALALRVTKVSGELRHEA